MANYFLHKKKQTLMIAYFAEVRGYMNHGVKLFFKTTKINRHTTLRRKRWMI